MMKFKNLKLGQKFSIFGGITVLAMVVIMVLSGKSSRTTHRDLASYRDAANASEFFQTLEIDHLKWVNTIEDAILSNAEGIAVETDHKRCNLGHFLYGEERTAMVQEFPKLTNLLKELETPHRHLHESSISMIEVWEQIHPGLIEDLGLQLDNHRVWASTITSALLNEENPSVEIDPTKCNFGKWLASEKVIELRESPLFSESIREAEEIHNNMHSSVDELIHAQTHEEKKSIYNGPIKEGLHHFAEALSTMIATEGHLLKAQEEAIHIYHGELTEALEHTQHALNEAEHIAHLIEEDRMEHLDHKLKETLWEIIIGSLLAIGFSIILGLIILRLITRPVKDCEAFALKLAEGNFTENIDIDQEDEIGRLGKSLNKMVEGLREGFGQIREGVNSLASSTTELSAISSQLASNAEKSSEVSTTVAASTEETSQSMTSVAASVEEMSANLQALATSSGEMKSTINEVAKNTEKGREMTQKAVSLVGSASSKMGDLDNAVQLIGNITDTIKGISDQTNLLALNATIEAASAGEAGKGFAVVANEIKELSRQTAQATEQISISIGSIQSSTSVSLQEINGVVEAIEEIDNITSLIASAVEEQSYTTNEIASNVSQTAEGVHEISSNVAQVNEATLAVAEDVSHVRLSSEEIAAASTQLNSSTVEISHFAEELSQIAGKYKV